MICSPCLVDSPALIFLHCLTFLLLHCVALLLAPGETLCLLHRRADLLLEGRTFLHEHFCNSLALPERHSHYHSLYEEDHLLPLNLGLALDVVHQAALLGALRLTEAGGGLLGVRHLQPPHQAAVLGSRARGGQAQRATDQTGHQQLAIK